MTGTIRNHIQLWPVVKSRASAANGVSAMIVSRWLAKAPRHAPSVVPTRLVIPLPLSDPAGLWFSSLMQPILPVSGYRTRLLGHDIPRRTAQRTGTD